MAFSLKITLLSGHGQAVSFAGRGAASVHQRAEAALGVGCRSFVVYWRGKRRGRAGREASLQFSAALLEEDELEPVQDDPVVRQSNLLGSGFEDLEQ